MVRTLHCETGFVELQYRSYQICFVSNFARDKVDQEISVAQLVLAFECHANRIKAALANGLEGLKVRGRHPVFDEDSGGEILAWIKAQAEKYRPMKRKTFTTTAKCNIPALSAEDRSTPSSYSTQRI
jgi:hypothetical protein